MFITAYGSRSLTMYIMLTRTFFKAFLRKLYCDTSQAYPAIVIIANPRLLRVIGSSNEAHTVDA